MQAAALATDRGAVDRAVLHMGGFRFSDVTDVWAEDYLPGALKYGDVRGLLLQAGGTQLSVSGIAESDAIALESAFSGLGPGTSLRVCAPPGPNARPAFGSLVPDPEP
jgi:hypothetical protein